MSKSLEKLLRSVDTVDISRSKSRREKKKEKREKLYSSIYVRRDNTFVEEKKEKRGRVSETSNSIPAGRGTLASDRSTLRASSSGLILDDQALCVTLKKKTWRTCRVIAGGLRYRVTFVSSCAARGNHHRESSRLLLTFVASRNDARNYPPRLRAIKAHLRAQIFSVWFCFLSPCPPLPPTPRYIIQ